MIKFKHVSAAAFVCAAAMGTTGAACDYCDANVTLTKALSECYLENYQNELDRMVKDDLPAQLINLGACDGAETVTRGTGLPNLPLPTGGDASAQDITLSFLLDADGLTCLAADLQTTTWSADAVRTFEVNCDCAAE